MTSSLSVESARQRLYEIVRRDEPFEKKARDVLELGAEYLGADIGVLTRIDRDTNHWEVLVSTDSSSGKFSVGVELDLESTYCRRVLADDTQIPLHDVPNQGWEDDVAFETHGLHCYHGTELIVDTEPFGTVCFVADEPRDEPFSDDETRFAELLAQLLERELERSQVEAELTSRTNLANVLNRVLRHNLRNDMSVIRGYTELMAERLEDDLHTQTVLSHIDDLIELSNKARELEQIVAADSERQQRDLVSIVESISETISQQYPEASVALEHDKEVTAAVLPNFERAVEELIENAAKHGGEEPTVTVTIDSVPNAVDIRIRDDGPGLAEPEVEVLKTGTETQLTHGRGLGLWSAHQIVTSHDGIIDATVTDEGTVMTISVPRTAGTRTQQQLTELTQARDQYLAAFEEASDAMVIINDDARIIEANTEASRIFGVDSRQLLGRSIPEFLSDDLDFEAGWYELQQCGTAQDVRTIIGADGVERSVEFSATADIVPGQHLVIYRDITDRKERKQELERTRDLLEQAERIADVGGWELEADSMEVFWTDHTFELLGIDDEEEPSLDAALDIYHEDDRPVVESGVENALDSAEPFDVEVRFRRSDGEVRWARVQGTPTVEDGEVVSVRGAIQDITEKQGCEQLSPEISSRAELNQP